MSLILEINGEPLDLIQGQGLSFELTNPLFETTGTYTGDFSWPLTVPLTTLNKVKLGFVNNPSRTVPMGLEMGGLLRVSGLSLPVTAKVVRVKADTVDLQLLLGGSRIARGLSSLSLQDLSFGPYDMLEDHPGGGNVVSGMAPTLAVTYAFAIAEWMKQTSASPLRGMPHYRGMCFPQIYNKYFAHDDVNTPDNPFSGKFNDWNPSLPSENTEDGLGRYVVDPSTGPQAGAMPFFFLQEVVRKIAAYFGFSGSGTLFSDENLQRLVLVTNRMCEARISNGTGGSIYINVPENKIYPSRFLPNVTCADLFRAMHTTLFIAPSFDFLSGDCKFVELNELLSGEVKDWTDKAAGIVEQVADDFEGLTLKYTIGGLDSLIGDYIKEMKDVRYVGEMTYDYWYANLNDRFNPTAPIKYGQVAYITDRGCYVIHRPYDGTITYDPVWTDLYALPLQDRKLNGRSEWIATGRGFMTIAGKLDTTWESYPWVKYDFVDMDASANNEEIVFSNYLADYRLPTDTGDSPTLAPVISGWPKLVRGEPRGINFDWQRGGADRGSAWLAMIERNKYRKVTMDMKLTSVDILTHRWHERIQIGADMYMIGRMRPVFPVAGLTRVELYYVG